MLALHVMNHWNTSPDLGCNQTLLLLIVEMHCLPACYGSLHVNFQLNLFVY